MRPDSGDNALVKDRSAKQLRSHNAKKRAMKAVENADLAQLLRQPRKLQADVTLGKVQCCLPCPKSRSDNPSPEHGDDEKELELALTVEQLSIKSRNSSGAIEAAWYHERYHTEEDNPKLREGLYGMHEMQIKTLQAELRNFKMGYEVPEFAESFLKISNPTILQFASRIADHPRWPREMFTVHFPQIKANISDDGIVALLKWAAFWKTTIQVLRRRKAQNRTAPVRPGANDPVKMSLEGARQNEEAPNEAPQSFDAGPLRSSRELARKWVCSWPREWRRGWKY